MKHIFLAILLLIASTSSFAQSLKAYEKAADKAFEQHDFYNALHYYDLVLKSNKDLGILYKYAESARLSYAYDLAEEAYAKVAFRGSPSKFPLARYHYAGSLKHNGKYSKARAEFKQFLKRHKEDDFFKKKANQEVVACSLAAKLVKLQYNKKELELKHLSDNVNSEYSDFAPFEYKDTLYFSSLKYNRKREKGEKREKTTSDRLVSKLLQSNHQGEKKAVQLDALNSRSKHSANASIGHNGKYMYYTICSAKKSDSLVCQVYYTELDKKGKWSEGKIMPEVINAPNSSSTHPHITYNSTTKTSTLFFVSNRKEGYGESDIWQIQVNKTTVIGAAQNLGETINSIDAEATPFYDQKLRRLYFASMWHPGLGGYDIFYSDFRDSTWSTPKNIGVPFNSASNDLYFVVNANDTTGYFASNRAGSRAITKEACCNDIYYYAHLKTPKIDTPIVKKTTRTYT